MRLDEIEPVRLQGRIDLETARMVVHCPYGHEVVIERLAESDHVLDEADRIWNRATTEPSPGARAGDAALAAVLIFHGLVMNGGFPYALEIGYDEALRAREGFLHLGAPDLAGLLAEGIAIVAPLARVGEFDILQLSEPDVEELERLNVRYNSRVPEDQVLENIFRRYRAEHPDEFAPIH